MNICELFIRRPVGTSLLAMGLAIGGMYAYWILPVASLPRIDFPMVVVYAQLPGADAETIASSLAAPLEKRLGQIAGVNEMTSSSTLGGTTITLQFDIDRSVDAAARDVQAAINAAAADLPANLPSPPTYRKVNPADTPILILAMYSSIRTSAEVFEAADEVVGQRLNQVKGVSEVFISGAEKSAIRVQTFPGALANAGISLEEIRAFLGAANVNSPKGVIEAQGQSWTISSNDQMLHPEPYQRLIFRQQNGTPILLCSLANIEEGVENTRLEGWDGERPAVLLIIFKQPDANVIETVERIKSVLPRMKSWIPSGIDIHILADRTLTIRSSVREVQIALVVSIALVIVVIALFLRRFWPTFIAGITVPLAMAGTFAAMVFLNYTLDNFSLMAIAICVGFVVDDAIVVIENIFRHVEAGDSGIDAALKGSRQIGFTILSMTLSLIAVFFPLLFMSGLIGRIFHEFAVTLSMAILISGVVALTLTPMLCSRFLKRESKQAGVPGRFMQACADGFDWLLARYEAALRWVLRHQTFMLWITFSTLLLTGWLYVKLPKGFFPQQDTGVLLGITEARQDVSFIAMSQLQQQIGRIILADPDVDTMGSFIGATIGSSAVNNGRIFISLKPYEKRKSTADQVLERIRKATAGLPGITIYLQSIQDVRMGGRLGKGQYQYALQAADLDDLNVWSSRLVDKLRQSPLLQDVSSDLQALGAQSNIVIDRDAASRLGITPTDIDNTLYDAFGQRQVSILYKRYNQHHVILEAEPSLQFSPESLDLIRVRASNGQLIPLSTVARFEPSNTYLSINHQGQFPAATITFNLAPGVALGVAYDFINKTSRDLRMPARVHASFQGTAQLFQSSLATTPFLFFASLVCVYIILGMLYESLVHPLTILSTLPSAGVGALLALMVFGIDLSLVSFIGIILLMGIVKKNAIMMIDFALNVQRHENRPPEQAIYQACVIRFRPIMMTTMAALLGALPLAIGFGIAGSLRRPLGIAVVGGLIVSQSLTLFSTPVIYLALERLRKRR